MFCFTILPIKNRHEIVDDMKSRLIDVLKWTRITVLFVLLASPIGHTESKHTRHPHKNTAHRRATRSDIRTNLSYEKVNSEGKEYTQTFAKQASKITLECGVNINFSASVWLKDGQIVSTQLRDGSNKRMMGRFFMDTSGTLTIDNVRLEDDGKWLCEVEDAFGFVLQGKPIVLTVLDPPKKAYIMIDNRILDPGNPFIPVKENADLTVSCVVDDGVPKPLLSWELTLGSMALLDMPELPLEVLNLTETTVDQRVGARNDARMMKVMRAHHNATLTCFVRHIALDQPLNVSVLLNVQYTPSFAITREPGFGIPIREGIAVSLKCDVDSNPAAKPIWQKDEGDPPIMQSPDGYLNFTEIKREHSGWYKCMARHMLGMFSSIGYYLKVHQIEVTQLPDFDVGELSSTRRQVEVSLGGAVQLACPLGTTGCWARLDGGSGKLEPVGASQELRLDDVVYQEGGEYKCVAPPKDKSKRIEAIRNAMSVQLVVKGAPTVSPTSENITAVYGQPLTLTMEFCANPEYTKVFWVAKNERVFQPGDADKRTIAYGITNTSSPNCHQAVLFLTKVTLLDKGEYNLIVRSPNGLTEGTFFVNVTFPTDYNGPYFDTMEAAAKAPRIIFNTIYINVILLVLTNC